jgi:hypothetical protein
MKKPKPSVIPRFGTCNVAGEAMDIDNLQVAAVIYAFDVPLHHERPYDVQAGDGIKGVRVIWHFDQTDRGGNSPKLIAKNYKDEEWIAGNPQHPLAICKRAFDEHAKLKNHLRKGDLPKHTGPACRVTNTRMAAVLVALGHKLHGWQRNDYVTTWCFDEAAATDAALYVSDDLYENLPDSAISYARGALLGHEAMIAASKQIQTARITHRGRAALIGKDIDQTKQDTIEKLLFRK